MGPWKVIVGVGVVVGIVAGIYTVAQYYKQDPQHVVVDNTQPSPPIALSIPTNGANVDHCIVGTWALQLPTTADIQIEPGVHLTGKQDGFMSYTFGPDGTGSVTIQAKRSATQNGHFYQRTIEGANRFTYAASNGQLTYGPGTIYTTITDQTDQNRVSSQTHV